MLAKAACSAPLFSPAPGRPRRGRPVGCAAPHGTHQAKQIVGGPLDDYTAVPSWGYRSIFSETGAEDLRLAQTPTRA